MSKITIQEVKDFFFQNQPGVGLDIFEAGGKGYIGIEEKKCYFSIPLNGEKQDFHESFASVTLFARKRKNYDYELIFCWEGERNQIPDLFISMGLTEFFPDDKRKKLYNNPEIFANQLKEVFGNSNVLDPIADKIAELYVYSKLLENNMQPKFSGFSEKGTIDIECSTFDVEVKSTTRHHDWIINTSSEQLQTNPNRPLYLLICRLEPTQTPEFSLSIQKLYDELTSRGITKLSGLPQNTSDRERLYKITDTKVIEVNSNFPRPELHSNGAILVRYELQLIPDQLNALSLENFLQSNSY